MHIATGSDDAGAPLLAVLISHLQASGHGTLLDLGAAQGDGEEYYPDVAERVARAVADGRCQRGILVCGTGIGMSITANKIPGIRAALCHDTYSAERARKSNDAQILTMGARVIGPELGKAIVDAWLEAEFDECSPSGPKVQRMKEIDNLYTRNPESEGC
ncbi:MAG: RpiB/LacA/LacB family sugar-phosphate isomerase [Anaerolineaceae bacterium]|nr:RpiB/LacA/LacB family sugar-phosphate isomerase [Anaerolineaceae bacterium]